MPRCSHRLIDQTVGLFITDYFFLHRVVMEFATGADGDVGQVHQIYTPSRRRSVTAGLFTGTNRLRKPNKRCGVGHFLQLLLALLVEVAHAHATSLFTVISS